MTKLIFITLSFFSIIHLNAQINYTDYGNSWLISMETAVPLDLNNDGTVDFYINNHAGKLGFNPVNLTGCLQSISTNAYNNIGTREVEILQKGDLVQMSNANMFDYIDDDNTAIYDNNHGFADGWSNLSDQYIGFGVVSEHYIYNGWMKIAIHEESKALYIKEIAYVIDSFGQGGIIVGDKGVTSLPNLSAVLNEVNLFPNPAVDQVQLRYDYQGNDNLVISLQSAAGQEITRLIGTKGASTLNIPLYDYNPGIYFIRFETQKGTHVEKIILSK